MTDVSAFDEHRPLLFSIAYRMLGSASDAEDVVQDAWLRYHGADDVRSPRAFAATIVTRLCLDRLKSARASREEYVGPWLPEPILTTAAGPGPSAVEGPDVTLQRSESVTLAFLVADFGGARGVAGGWRDNRDPGHVLCPLVTDGLMGRDPHSA